MNIEGMNLQYITNEQGEKTAVILSISQFQELLEDFEDLRVVAERQHEATISHEDLVEELTQDGLLSD